MRAVVLALAVALDAVAFATLLRPRYGYTSTHRLLIVLAVGVGAAIAALLLAGAAAAFRRRRDRSLWSATTALPTISFVVAAFIAAAVASQIVRVIPTAGSQGRSASAARADFQRWQATVVPIVVTWMHAVRADSAFAHGLPTTPETALRRRVARTEQTFARLARSLAADFPRLPQRPGLRRLTNQLQSALMVARRAQQTYALALAAAPRGGVTGRLDRTRIRRLIARGNAEAQRSLAIMAAFSFDANKLGGSLFVEQP